MIEVKDLTKYYGRIAAVRDISFEVEQGEIIGFLGPNGAGKTTTMRILTGFSPASSGLATIDGFNISTHPIEVKKRVGYLPESVPLYHEMLVNKFLSYVAAIKGIPSKGISIEVGRVVERCGLEEVSQRIIGNLSKGYRQRVGLAQSLVGNPPVLILDEPTVGLDPRQIVGIRQMIKELAQDHTVLLSTHILPEVAMICERVIIINQGRIVAQDTMANLAGSKNVASIELEVAGSRSDIVKVVEGVKGVIQVTCSDSGHYKVVSNSESSISEELINVILNAGFGLKSIGEHSRTLEDIFLEAISSEEDWTSSSEVNGAVQ